MTDQMTINPSSDLLLLFRQALFNGAGRLRSGWRFAVFSVAMLLALMLVGGGLVFVLASAFGSTQAVMTFFESPWGFVAQALLLLIPALVIGWICCSAFEDLPFDALGWARHQGWLRDLLTGAWVGAGSMLLAVMFSAMVGGFRFSISPSNLFFGVAQTLFVSALIFALAAAAEEALFRGYPLQTMLRSLPAWVALIPSSILFAVVHLDNPNVARGFTFFNTMLAGLWLAIGFLRTRSLWFPLGLHWSWNWTMGALLGVPVSGITQITPQPLLRTFDHGPVWLTGGAYGVEGGAACTLALLLSSLFIWRTNIVTATPEMRSFTDGERLPTTHNNESSLGLL